MYWFTFSVLKMFLCKSECMSLVTDESWSSHDNSSGRPSWDRSSATSLLMGNPKLPPFIVEPRIGTINLGVTQTFNVCFSPMEVSQFQGTLLCR